jgi:hypothetical protein
LEFQEPVFWGLEVVYPSVLEWEVDQRAVLEQHRLLMSISFLMSALTFAVPIVVLMLVELLPVALLLVALLPVALLPVALLPVALLPVVLSRMALLRLAKRPLTATRERTVAAAAAPPNAVRYLDRHLLVARLLPAQGQR